MELVGQAIALLIALFCMSAMAAAMLNVTVMKYGDKQSLRLVAETLRFMGGFTAGSFAMITIGILIIVLCRFEFLADDAASNVILFVLAFPLLGYLVSIINGTIGIINRCMPQVPEAECGMP